jgi:hypothetical protein
VSGHAERVETGVEAGVESAAGEWCSASVGGVWAGVLWACAGRAAGGSWRPVFGGRESGREQVGRPVRRAGSAGWFWRPAPRVQSTFFPAFSRPQPNIRNIIGRCVGIWKMAWEWPAPCLRDSLGHPAARFERSVAGAPQNGSVSRSAAAHRPRAARDMRGPWRASEPMR